MTANLLRFAANVELPLDAVTQKIAAVGRSGSGKSYAASKLVELLLEAKLQVVVVDPVGIHWSLRLSADGEGRGFDIPVLGGEHQEIPLEPTAGKIIAELVAEKRASLVLDVSMMTGAEQRRFVADFAKELLHAKKKNRSPVMIVWEESQEFVPQRVGPREAEMVGAMEKLIKIGRNFGIGTFLITQRPQATNKDVLNQTEVLIVFQMTGAHERKAILEWVVDKGLDKRLVDSLAALREGDGYLWSPGWLRRFEKFRALQRKTLDISATPKVGGVDTAHTVLPEIDLEAVKKAMAATIERAKAEDPRELRRRIRELEVEISKRDAHAPPLSLYRGKCGHYWKREGNEEACSICAELANARVEVPVLDDKDRSLVMDFAESLGRVEEGVRDAIREYVPDALEASAKILEKLNGRNHSEKGEVVARTGHRRSLNHDFNLAPSPRRDAPRASAPSAEGLTGPEERILDGLARLKAIGIEEPPRAQVALLARYKSTASTGFPKGLSSLHVKGLVSYPTGGCVALTDAALDILGDIDHPVTTEELHDMVREVLAGVEWRVLEPLINRRGDAVDRETLAQEAGYQSTASTGFPKAVSRLSSLGLVDYPSPGMVRATPMLFLEDS